MNFPLSLLLRIACATCLGGVIGYERDRHGRPAGLRTHMLVALAASTFMVISTHFVYFQHYASSDLVEIDASRIAASIVTGMGFLAGGAIMRTGLNVHGLTTAAGLWLVGAIGMAAGAGMYAIAGFVTLVGVVALTLLRRFEDKDDRSDRRRVAVTLGPAGSLTELAGALGDLGASMVAQEYDRQLADQTLAVTLDVLFPRTLGVERVLQAIEQQRDVRRVRLEPTA